MIKKKLLVITLVPILISVSLLSGCIAANAIQTKHWEHINSEGTGVRLWGFLVLGENFHNWDGYFVYDTESHPDWENYANRVEADNYDSLNFFSVDIYDLNRTTTYHYRAVGENTEEGATIRVGRDLTFIPGGPRSVIKNPTSIGLDYATLEGELTHMGGADSCEVYFKYGTDLSDLNLETTHQTMTSTGDFNAYVSDLESGTTYYYHAYAKNDADTWVSIFHAEFIPGQPTVETYLPNDVTSTTALFRGELFSLGGMPTCEVWFEYGDDNPNQLDETTDPITLDSPGYFTIDVDGLKSDTTYWVRAVADNSLCQHKGVIKEFKTLATDKKTNKEIFDKPDISDTIKNTLKKRIMNWLDIDDNWMETIDDVKLKFLNEQYPSLMKILQ